LLEAANKVGKSSSGQGKEGRRRIARTRRLRTAPESHKNDLLKKKRATNGENFGKIGGGSEPDTRKNKGEDPRTILPGISQKHVEEKRRIKVIGQTTGRNEKGL